MKNYFFLFFILVIYAQAFPQENTTFKPFQSGSWELNLLGDFGSSTTTTEFQGEEYSEDQKYFQLHAIPGYFFVKGFSFEAEFNFLFIEREKPAYSIVPNISYSFQLPSTPSLAIYARAGYGISNSHHMLNLLLRTSDALDVSVLNAGAGLKFFISEHAVIRTEVNFRKTSYDNSESFSSGYIFDYSESVTQTRLLIGFSILI